MNNSDYNRIPRKKVAWVTPDYFVDCDFNIDILKDILVEYDIYWFVLLPSFNARFQEKDFLPLMKLDGLKIEFLYSTHRQRNPMRLMYYFKIYQKIRKINPSVVFLNCVPDPYFVPISWLFDKNKTILCAHDGGVNGGFDFKLISRISFNLSYRYFKHVCMFSKSQAKIFKEKFPDTNVHLIDLALKEFGKPQVTRPEKPITFLSFGVINFSKNIESLIDAACHVYAQGYRNFRVSINGYCNNWEFYSSKIIYPEIFDCDIRIIENTEIPDLFHSSQYFVQPYRHMSQSGAMKVAFNYNLPVIASNLPGFADEITEGVNGYLYESSETSSDSLQKKLIEVITSHETKYPLLLEKMRKHTADHYSAQVIAKRYLNMFNHLQ